MRDRYYDNSRLADAKRCFRKYYFRHGKDWELAVFNKDLAFGSGWHEGMDVIWLECAKTPFQDLNIPELVQSAFDAFMAKWLDEGGIAVEDLGPEELKALGTKSPMIAKEMFYEYILARRSFFEDPTFELLACEQPFAVPLDPDDDSLFYVGRMDKVFRKQGGIYVGEHKTSSLYSVASGFRSTFLDSFSPNSQVDGYLHAIHMLYGEEAKAVWVDAALCHAKHHDIFQFIPIERKHEQLEAWLFDTKWWIQSIEESWEVVDSCPDDDPYLAAFPKNTEACMDYGRNCPFHQVCRMVPNPKSQQLPPGYREFKWSPFDRLHLDKLGMEK